ncbi:hypothetical protein [Sphingomonas oryzagri]
MSEIVAAIPAVAKMVADAQLEAAQKITNEVYRNVVIASPVAKVDGGTFRQGWQMVEPTAAFTDGEVSNNIPYAVPLAHGHSPQAPDGWIDNSIEAAVRHTGK